MQSCSLHPCIALVPISMSYQESFQRQKNAQVCVFEPLDCLNIQGKKSELIKISWGPPLFLVLLLKMIQVSEVDEPPEGPGAVGELDRVAPLIADPPPLKGRSP